MAHAYTPGLKVSEHMMITKKRILPLKGKVMVKQGDIVTPETVIARTELPGEVHPINIANLLNIPPEEVNSAMVKKVGDHIKEGEVIAQNKSFFGLLKSNVKAKMDGSIESISSVTGQVMTRGVPIPVEVKAYITGKVVKIYENEGADVVCKGAFVQGIFGICGEVNGPIYIASKNEKESLEASQITPDMANKIVVGGSFVTADALRKAIEYKVAGVVVGGIDDKDLRDFLKKDLGVAITGSEDIGVTLIVTEGFGEIAMAHHTFSLLKKHEGKIASINGATQIRAGVIRPEVIIPLEGNIEDNKTEAVIITGLEVGSRVRVIRQPYFGMLGEVVHLPPELTTLDSGSKARILEVQLDNDHQRAIIPRANVELLE